MLFKCHKCDADMELDESEGKHVCHECNATLTIDEATELFDNGEIVAVIDEDEVTKFDKDEVIITDLDEDIAALTEGEDLSEAFVVKAKTIFEAAVASRVAAKEAELAEAQEEKLEEAQAELIEKVDGYLDHVISEWMKENELAIEAGLKTEMNESFADGIAELLKDHYISAPEDRWDIVEGLADKVEALESKLDESMEKEIKAEKELVEAEKAIAFVEVTSGLADTQVEKLKGLAEGVEANSVDDFVEKVETLKESYFGTKKEVILDEKVDETVVKDTTDASLAAAVRMLGLAK